MEKLVDSFDTSLITANFQVKKPEQSAHNQIASDYEQAVDQLREILIDCSHILEKDSATWGPSLGRLLIRHSLAIERHPESYDPAVRSFLQNYLPEFLAMLKDCTSQTDIYERALEIIHSTSEFISQKIGTFKEPVQSQFVTLQEMLGKSSEWLKIIEKDGKFSLEISAEELSGPVLIPIPASDNVCLKGGPARVLLKIFAGASRSSILSDLPLNDIDAVVLENDDEALKEALELGADREGIELSNNLKSDNLLSDRDVTMNSCLLTRTGLIYSSAAYESAKTGIVRPLDSDRAMFGKNYFYHEDQRLMEARPLMRLLKMVVEGKAEGFYFTKRNGQIDMGIYHLVLARKFAAKEGAPILFEKFFDVASKMGQVQPGESNIFELLDRVHQKYPFFNLAGSSLDKQGVVRWLAGKLNTYLVRALKKAEGLKSTSKLQIEENDSVPFLVTASNVNQQVSTADFKVQWQEFVERCRVRTETYNKRLASIEQGIKD